MTGKKIREIFEECLKESDIVFIPESAAINNNNFVNVMAEKITKATNDSKPELDDYKTADLICELMLRFKDRKYALYLLNKICRLPL